MARLQALLDGGFSFSSGFGDKRQTFRVSTLGGEVWVPDDVISKEKATIDQLLADGAITFVTDTDRQGPRVLTVLAAELGPSPATPLPLNLQGEPVQAVITAYVVSNADAITHINAGSDYLVVDGEVFWDGADLTASHKYAVFFVE